MFYHLLHYDCSDFDPQGHAPQTTSKIEMIDSSRNEMSTWVSVLRETPDQVTVVGQVVLPYKLFTSQELYNFFDSAGQSRYTVNGLGRELRRNGFKQLRDGTNIRTASNGVQKLWAVRDCEAMHLLRQPKDIADVYDNERKNRTKYGQGQKGAKY